MATIEQLIIKEHTDIRPCRACTRQLLYLTHNIVDGYQESMVTGTDLLTCLLHMTP